VITVYASAAFVIIELVNNLSEPLNLPSVLATIVIIVLAVGFPLAVILSWIYDLAGEGIQKTKSIDDLSDDRKSSVPNAWKIATIISFLVILVLLTFNIVGSTKKLHAGDIQSLVILPFENYTGDDQLENMVSSMHALLIGDMGRIADLRVLGKTTSSKYKEGNLTAGEIASELNVDAVVEATVMCLGDSVCMQFRLVNTTGDEEQLWVGDYKEDKTQMLNLYNQVTRQIAEEVMIELTPEEERILAKSRTVDREAFDAFLKSHQYWGDASLASLNQAKEYLISAIEKDPQWAPLYSGLAKVWMGLSQMGFVSPVIAGPEIYKNLNKALELDPENADSHQLAAMIAYLAEWNWEKSEQEFLKAIANNPNDAYSRIYYAHLLDILQRPAEAALQARLAYELDPLDPTILVLYSWILRCAQDYESSLLHAEKALELDPGNFLVNVQIGGSAYRCQDYKKTFESEKSSLQVYSGGQYEEEAFQEIDKVFEKQGFYAAYERILQLYEDLYKKGLISPGRMASRYIMGNQQEEALVCLERAYKVHDPLMPYIATGGYPYYPLYDNNRFIAILDKMKLPPPKTQ
jgi:serine/threonine-protein kinase